MNERHKPFHHSCQFACSFLGVAPRQQDDTLSMADPEPVHGDVHLVAHPVGCQFPKQERANQVLSSYLLLSWSYTGSQVGESERRRHIAPPLRLSDKEGSTTFLGGNRLCCPAKEQSW